MASHPPTASRTVFNEVLGGLPTTIFEKMSLLAAKHGSINLGQGFPDNELEGPRGMKEEAHRAMVEESNQYPPMFGVPDLRRAIAEHSERYQGLPVDAQTEVLVTSGATEALAAAFLGLLNPGDRVVLFAPLYDSYLPILRRAGAEPVVLSLLPERGWNPDLGELRAAFAAGPVAAVVLNAPHNPTGSVPSEEFLRVLAELVVAGDSIAILDEVYEHLVYPGSEHVSLRTFPGLAERAVRIGSAGKTFSFTAWKVGWLSGPRNLVLAAAKAHQFLTFTTPSALQRAVAKGLDDERAFYEGLGPLLADKRARLSRGLEAIGFRVLPAQATYFLVADFSPLIPEGSDEDDVSFCARLTVDGGVTLIPVSAFYPPDFPGVPRTLVRFVTCKVDQKLDAALAAIARYLGKEDPIPKLI